MSREGEAPDEPCFAVDALPEPEQKKNESSEIMGVAQIICWLFFAPPWLARTLALP